VRSGSELLCSGRCTELLRSGSCGSELLCAGCADLLCPGSQLLRSGADLL
jgi:hypothetical protein